MKKTFLILMSSVAVLLVWSLFLTFERANGTPLVVEIEGFDPRSLIAGRYIAFQIKYKTDLTCGDKRTYSVEPSYFCWKTKKITRGKPSDCPVFFKGECRWGRFSDNLSRYYVPEIDADALDKDFQKRDLKFELLLSVTKRGDAYAKELLIDGKSWRERYRSKTADSGS